MIFAARVEYGMDKVRVRPLSSAQLTCCIPPTCPRPQICCELGDPYEVPEQTPIVWYLALRAADAFKGKNGRYPGEEDDQVH